jgi:tetratricopeptide (TPR) repeat protein
MITWIGLDMVSKLQEIGFPLEYVEKWSDLSDYKDLCDQIIDKSFDYDLDDGSKFFITATQNLINGDTALETGAFIKAINFHETAERMFSSILSNEDVHNEIFREARRRVLYAQTRKFHASALKALNEKEDYDTIINHFRNAVNAINQEIIYDQQNLDMYHLVLAIRLLSLIYVQMAKLQAQVEIQMSRDPRQYYYSAISNAKKALFVGGNPNLRKNITQWKKSIAISTVDRYQRRCDVLFDEALALATQEKYLDSARKFWQAAKYYEHIQKISASSELVLQQKLMESGCYEQLAKNLMEEDRNQEAADFFIKARELLAISMSTWKELGQSEMVLFLSVQQEFYDEMAAFCRAIKLFDNDQPNQALDQLKMTLDAIRDTLTTAEQVDNSSVTFSCKKAIQQVESYIETIKLML